MSNNHKWKPFKPEDIVSGLEVLEIKTLAPAKGGTTYSLHCPVCDATVVLSHSKLLERIKNGTKKCANCRDKHISPKPVVIPPPMWPVPGRKLRGKKS